MFKKMKGLIFCFLSIISLVCVTSRPFTPIFGHAAAELGPPGTNKGLQTTMTMTTDQDRTSRGTENNSKEVKKLGSSPPSCTHKCYGCVPCEAIQVPTTKGRVGVQYANYEPEGWKCKCGPTLYTP